MTTSKPKRGQRTAKHMSKKEGHAKMADMMQRKVHHTQQMREQNPRKAKYK